jgi:hypothetical protein
VPADQIDRIPCGSVSREILQSKYIRSGTPVLITGCDYGWMSEGENAKVDLSVRGVTKVSGTISVNENGVLQLSSLKMFHGNDTFVRGTPVLPTSLPGFTHLRTPNDDLDDSNEIMQELGWNRNQICLPKFTMAQIKNDEKAKLRFELGRQQNLRQRRPPLLPRPQGQPILRREARLGLREDLWRGLSAARTDSRGPLR